MKLDMDLVRSILLSAEEYKNGYVNRNPQCETLSRETIGYHVYLMGQAGLLEVMNDSSMNSPSPSAIIRNITWEGHQFLANARNDTIWDKAKAQLGSASIEVWRSVLIELAKKAVGLSLSQ
jgi:Hypothetical protein (DUF2513)